MDALGCRKTVIAGTFAISRQIRSNMRPISDAGSGMLQPDFASSTTATAISAKVLARARRIPRPHSVSSLRAGAHTREAPPPLPFSRSPIWRPGRENWRAAEGAPTQHTCFRPKTSETRKGFRPQNSPKALNRTKTTLDSFSELLAVQHSFRNWTHQ